MNLEEFEHAIRAAAAISGHRSFLVIGSQSILPWTTIHGDVPPSVAMSNEVDIAAPEQGDHVDELEAIGRGSDFEERFGFYVDPVDWDTGDFPSGWTDRLLTWTTSDDLAVMVPEPHDLAAAKLSASRTQDIDFVAALLLAQWLDVETLHDRVRLLADPTAALASLALAEGRTSEDDILLEAMARFGIASPGRCGKTVAGTQRPCVLEPLHSGRCRSSL
ncbi:MAG: DUF6036 family nucleotidyltransferase [Microthrixaceae bacterium]